MFLICSFFNNICLRTTIELIIHLHPCTFDKHSIMHHHPPTSTCPPKPSHFTLHAMQITNSFPAHSHTVTCIIANADVLMGQQIQSLCSSLQAHLCLTSPPCGTSHIPTSGACAPFFLFLQLKLISAWEMGCAICLLKSSLHGVSSVQGLAGQLRSPLRGQR